MWLTDFINLFFPNNCQACGETLIGNERIICIGCQYKLPLTNFHYFDNNPISRIFWGRARIYTATSFLFFNKGGNVQKLIHQLKYKSNIETGKYLGELFATDLIKSPLFSDLDVIIPVPLHAKKLRSRGFNQSEIIARGISNVLSIPVNTTSLLRSEFTETQTKKSRYSRWENVSGKFTLSEQESLKGKYVLLVDDVLTTGATLEACAQELLRLEDIKVSMATLAYAQV